MACLSAARTAVREITRCCVHAGAECLTSVSPASASASCSLTSRATRSTIKSELTAEKLAVCSDGLQASDLEAVLTADLELIDATLSGARCVSSECRAFHAGA